MPLKLPFLVIVFFALQSCNTPSVVHQPTLAEMRALVTNPETTLVDVRIPEEFNNNHAEGAMNIPLAKIRENLDFFRTQKNVVLYCNSGRQAGEALKILRKNGIKNIYSAKTVLNVKNLQNRDLKNILTYSDFNADQPTVFQIKKSDKIKYFSVALAKDVVLKKHITTIPTTLMVINGSVKLIMDYQEIQLNEFDVYEIPINIEHEVIGLDDQNLITLMQEL